jgi:hypothetical protein
MGQRYRRRSAAGGRPGGNGTHDLKIIARLSDGTSVSRAVTIRQSTGEVQELKLSSRRRLMLDEQLKRRSAN